MVQNRLTVVYNSATKKCFDLGTRSRLDKQKEDFYIEGGMQIQNGHKDRRTAPDVWDVTNLSILSLMKTKQSKVELNWNESNLGPKMYLKLFYAITCGAVNYDKSLKATTITAKSFNKYY